jgi:hypothetical protein
MTDQADFYTPLQNFDAASVDIALIDNTALSRWRRLY